MPTGIGYAGEVVEGMDVVKSVEAVGTSSGAPKVPVKISKCGVI